MTISKIIGFFLLVCYLNEVKSQKAVRLLFTEEDYPVFNTERTIIRGNQTCECVPQQPGNFQAVLVSETEWSAWSECQSDQDRLSFQCHTGVQFRNKICSASDLRENDCSLREWRYCYHEQSCKGEWVEWVTPESVQCSKSCGGGTRFRLRMCTLNLKIGLYCASEHRTPYDVKMVPCNTHECPFSDDSPTINIEETGKPENTFSDFDMNILTYILIGVSCFLIVVVFFLVACRCCSKNTKDKTIDIKPYKISSRPTVNNAYRDQGNIRRPVGTTHLGPTHLGPAHNDFTQYDPQPQQTNQQRQLNQQNSNQQRQLNQQNSNQQRQLNQQNSNQQRQLNQQNSNQQRQLTQQNSNQQHQLNEQNYNQQRQLNQQNSNQHRQLDQQNFNQQRNQQKRATPTGSPVIPATLRQSFIENDNILEQLHTMTKRKPRARIIKTDVEPYEFATPRNISVRRHDSAKNERQKSNLFRQSKTYNSSDNLNIPIPSERLSIPRPAERDLNQESPSVVRRKSNQKRLRSFHPNLSLTLPTPPPAPEEENVYKVPRRSRDNYSVPIKYSTPRSNKHVYDDIIETRLSVNN